MAYYTLFTSAWNTGTVPGGVTGSALTGQTTAQKLININGWISNGSIPTTIYVTGSQILNCINWTEFAALPATQQSNVLAMCQVPGNLLGGSANTTHLVPGMIIAYFPPAGVTITALSAMSAATPQPWWQANGYPRPFDMGDVTTNGLS